MTSSLAFSVLIFCLATGIRALTQEEITVAHGTSNLAKNWYQIVASKPGNVLISPGCASFVLGMLVNGAGGLTQSQIRDALLLPEDFETINSGYRTIIEGLLLAENENVTLELANKLFIEQSFSLYQTYQDILIDVFQSSIDQLNFSGDPEGSLAYINNWVNTTTHGRIQDLFTEDDITSNTLLVLTNAIYFNGKWRTAFNASLTSQETFYTSRTERTKVQMMHATAAFRYADMGVYKVLELPYMGEELSMWVILPKKRNGLRMLENNIHSINLTSINITLESRTVAVSLPKFSFQKTMEMGPDLEELGMTEMFTDDANFSGISVSSIRVSTVKQKTFIEVTEEGTEAAAVTGLVGVPISLALEPNIPIQFKADHPFMFMIKPSNIYLLFFGRFSDPEDVLSE